MRIITYREAVREAMTQEMQRDNDVFLLGQDVAGGAGREDKGIIDGWGGSFAVSKGMATVLGTDRVIDCTLAEAGYVGIAVAAATAGLRPIAEIMFSDFIWLAGDQLFNSAAKLRYISAGQYSCKLTVRTAMGGGTRAGIHHSQTWYSLATHIPGVKVVAPSNPYDAKGILTAAIRDDDPVIVFEHKGLYGMKGEVPEEQYEIPIGKAKILKEGTDITIVGISMMVNKAMEASKILAGKGINAEVIDPISLSPLDENTILESLAKTGHLVIVDESNPRCSIATDIAAMVASKGIYFLDAPIGLVTAPHTPVPFSPSLEDAYMPNENSIVDAVLKALS